MQHTTTHRSEWMSPHHRQGETAQSQLTCRPAPGTAASTACVWNVIQDTFSRMWVREPGHLNAPPFFSSSPPASLRIVHLSQTRELEGMQRKSVGNDWRNSVWRKEWQLGLQCLAQGRVKEKICASLWRVRRQNLEDYLRRCKRGKGQGQGRDITDRIAGKYYS